MNDRIHTPAQRLRDFLLIAQGAASRDHQLTTETSSVRTTKDPVLAILERCIGRLSPEEVQQLSVLIERMSTAFRRRTDSPPRTDL